MSAGLTVTLPIHATYEYANGLLVQLREALPGVTITGTLDGSQLKIELSRTLEELEIRAMKAVILHYDPDHPTKSVKATLIDSLREASFETLTTPQKMEALRKALMFVLLSEDEE